MFLDQLINALLRPLGAKLISTRHEERELRRLRALQARGHWAQPRYRAGLRLDKDANLRFLEQVCAPYRDALGALPRSAAHTRDGYYTDNIWFGAVDASVLYGVLRHVRPARIVEVGCGFSTRLMRRAIIDGGLATHLTCIDPEPRVDIQAVADEFLAHRVEDVAIERIVEPLHAGDILFIDSSHVVVTGGDVPFLFLEVLPRLRPGVLVHVHDMFFPYDYPESWVFELRAGWNEQYLVHAFLAGNEAFEMMWAGHFMWRQHREDVLTIIPHAAFATGAGSLWLRRV